MPKRWATSRAGLKPWNPRARFARDRIWSAGGEHKGDLRVRI